MRKILLIILVISIAITGCSNEKTQKEVTKNQHENSIENDKASSESKKDQNQNEELENKQSENKELENKKIENIEEKYKDIKPKEWSENIEGITKVLDTDKKEIALTLDACGGKNGSGFDKELIDFLIKNKIPATLFINYRWIESNKEMFLQLAKNDNFEIENHGYEHKPLSVNGDSIYGIEGTKSIEDAIEEIKLNEQEIYKLTGKKTRFFRSGTAYYDDVSVKIAKDLGYEIAGFSINGDAGASYSKEQVIQEVDKSKSGDIIICHFNQPNGDTYEGLKESLLNLKEEGYKFVKLEDGLK